MAVFWSYFQDFVGTENRGFNQIQKFFAEVFQITSSFNLAKKKKMGG